MRFCFVLQVELDVLDVERFECAELLFEPTRLGRDSLGAHQLVAKALETCAPSLRDTLLQNVLVTGGCAQLRGFKERLEQELKLVYPSEARKGLIQYVMYLCECTASSCPQAHSDLNSTRAAESCGHRHLVQSACGCGF